MVFVKRPPTRDYPLRRILHLNGQIISIFNGIKHQMLIGKLCLRFECYGLNTRCKLFANSGGDTQHFGVFQFCSFTNESIGDISLYYPIG